MDSLRILIAVYSALHPDHGVSGAPTHLRLAAPSEHSWDRDRTRTDDEGHFGNEKYSTEVFPGLAPRTLGLSRQTGPLTS